MLDFSRFQAITFDCYGTLVDWESGIRSALMPILEAHERPVDDENLFTMYSEAEAAAERGEYRPYRDVLRSVTQSFGQKLGFCPTEAELNALADSVPSWLPYPDTNDALRQLGSHFRLFVISNIDDDMFAATRKRINVEFDGVVTAQQAGSYKPSLNNFGIALERLGLRADQVLHAGQSIYHDVIPAKSLGVATVWVRRPSPRAKFGAALAAEGRPDLEVSSLAALAEAAAK